MRDRNESLWQHPAKLEERGFLTGPPFLPQESHRLSRLLALSVLSWEGGDAGTFTLCPNSSFFSSSEVLGFLLWKPGLPQKLTRPQVTAQLSALQALLDHSPEGPELVHSLLQGPQPITKSICPSPSALVGEIRPGPLGPCCWVPRLSNVSVCGWMPNFCCRRGENLGCRMPQSCLYHALPKGCFKFGMTRTP